MSAQTATSEQATSNPMATHGAFSWVEFHGTDPAAAQDFYVKVLGWNVAPMPMADGSAYPGILLGGQPVGGFSPRPDEGAAWLVYITVDDVDRRTTAATEAGAEVLSEPMTVPGVGRISILRDPQGARIAFITYPQP